MFAHMCVVMHVSMRTHVVTEVVDFYESYDGLQPSLTKENFVFVSGN